MTWMNEWEAETAYLKFRDDPDTPNLAAATTTLCNLVAWTNRNSDGWPYWQKPSNAAAKLQDLIQSVDRFDPEDITDAQLRSAYTPIKSFLTRQGVAHSEVFPAATQPRLHA